MKSCVAHIAHGHRPRRRFPRNPVRTGSLPGAACPSHLLLGGGDGDAWPAHGERPVFQSTMGVGAPPYQVDGFRDFHFRADELFVRPRLQALEPNLRPTTPHTIVGGGAMQREEAHRGSGEFVVAIAGRRAPLILDAWGIIHRPTGCDGRDEPAGTRVRSVRASFRPRDLLVSGLATFRFASRRTDEGRPPTSAK